MRINETHLLGGALLALSLIVWPGYGDEIRTPKAALFLVVAGLTLSFFLAKHAHVLLGALYGYVTLNAFFSGFGALQVREWIFIGCALGTGAVLAKSRDFSFFLKCILWLALLNAAYSYVQIFGYDFIFIYRSAVEMRTPTGFLGQQTLLGPVLASGLTAALFLQNFWLVPFFIGPIILTGSSFTFASTATGVYFYLVYRFGFRKMLPIPALGMIALVLLVKMDSELVAAKGRAEVWQATIERTLKDAPVFGHGFGTYQFYAPEIQSEHSKAMNGLYREAHNDFIQFFFDGGFFGLLILALLVFVFGRNAVNFIHVPEVACSAAIACLMAVNSMGNFPMRLIPQGLIAAWCAIFVITYGLRESAHGNYLRHFYR